MELVGVGESIEVLTSKIYSIPLVDLNCTEWGTNGFEVTILPAEHHKHVKSVLWRARKDDIEPNIYKFEDKSTGCIVLTAVRETTDLLCSITS